MGTKRVRREGRRLVCLLFSIAASLALMGCERLEFGYTKIGDLVKNPSQYGEQEIKIRGKVTDVVKLPFLEIKWYMVRDDTGEILVITSATTPGMGSEVRLKGAFGVVAILGGQAIGAHVRESQRW